MASYPLVGCGRVVDLMAGEAKASLRWPCSSLSSSSSSISCLRLPNTNFRFVGVNGRWSPPRKVVTCSIRALSATNVDSWKPDSASAPPCLSDIVWPSAGAFVAMAMLGKMDQVLAQKGLCLTVAPLGAVCAVLFIAPSSPAARKYNVFMAQIFCSAIGVLALSILGPGWLARSTALAASIAFMIYTRSVHPPAASLPILFIDGAKLHHLNYWYMLFPGATGCILLCLIQELVCYLKENYKF